jgi:serine/threonine protein kinase
MNKEVSDRRGTMVGTVNYMAPEMIQESESTCATDVYWKSSVPRHELSLSFSGNLCEANRLAKN